MERNEGIRTGERASRFTGELYRMYQKELASMITYLHQSVAAASCSPAAERLLEEIALADMRQCRRLALFLQKRGILPTPGVRLRTAPPIRLGRDRERLEALLRADIIEKERCMGEYAALADLASEPGAKDLLFALSEEERAHAATQRSFLDRLKRS